jgi:hypothetical protein
MEREVDRLVREFLSNTDTLTFYPISVLDVIIKSTEGQETRRQQLLEDAGSRTGAINSIVRLWARALSRSIEEALSTTNCWLGLRRKSKRSWKNWLKLVVPREDLASRQ